MENILEFKHITFSYDKKEILKNLSFNLKRNEFLSIVGASGCGKTTIIKIIGGIYENYTGEIIKSTTAYMPQKDLLLPWRKVIDNVLLPIELKKLNHRDKGMEYLKKVGLENCCELYPHELSGGMRQRVSFVRTLMSEPDILLLDEPFSALDAITKEEMGQWLTKTLEKFNKSVIFITHDINEAIYLSDRILVCTDTPLTNFDEFIVKDYDNSYLKNKLLEIIRNHREEL